ncbi:MAG: PAS domain-containing protein [Gemmatimonadales bacterium]|nr:PAS domain-containing protein [Gemmatimonadales bacterium]
MAIYAPHSPKFQGDTSPPPAIRFWLVGAGVVALAGEAARDGGWLLAGLTALAALGAAVGTFRLGGRALRAAGLALALLGAVAGTVAFRLFRVERLVHQVVAESVTEATGARDRLLGAALASATRAADNALQRLASSADRAPLDDLAADGTLERSIAVLAGDSILALVGPHRVAPVAGRGEVTLITTPFVQLAVVSRTRGAREAQVTLLLDAAPGVPTAGASLARGAGGWQRVGWHWNVPAREVRYTTVAEALAGVRVAMTAVPPEAGALQERERGLAKLLLAAAMSLVALLTLIGGAPTVVRAGAILVPLWAVMRAEVTPALLGPTAVVAMLAAVAMLLLAVLLWRRPLRRSPIGMVASILLLATAPPLVALVGRRVVPVTDSTSIVAWFWWQAVLALATAAFLAVASAPLRTPDDHQASSRWGFAAAIAAVVIGVIGIVAWQPAAWALWYAPLWLIPFAAFLPVTAPRARLVAIATTAGILAALSTWGASLEQRMALANADVARLGDTPDLEARAALDAFAITLGRDRPTTLDRLLVDWFDSPLQRLGVPTHLALWDSDGLPPRDQVALDALDVVWADLDSLVRVGGTTPRHVTMLRGAGRHEVLVLPLAADTIATVTIGPRSRLVVPTRFGRLIGWRAPLDPPYRMSLVSGVGSPGRDSSFTRIGRKVAAVRAVVIGDRTQAVRVELEMSRQRPFAVRAALVVLLDLFLVLGIWQLVQWLLTASVWRPQPVFQRSYRRTVATALAAFFIVPALLFTLWSVLRLRGDATRQRADEVTRTLRDVAVAGGLAIADAPAPDLEALRRLADREDTELGIYRRGRLVAASLPLLTDLGLMAPALDPAVRPAPGTDVRAVPVALPGVGLRLGVEQASNPETLIAGALPGSEADLAQEQVDLLLLLLLVSLGGGLAAVLVAGLVARALGQPIELLRRTALAIGRREALPPARDIPAEFGPVFGAIAQMQDDLQESETELEAGRARTAAILSTVATGVIGVDADGLVIHANPRATELLGRAVVTGAPLLEQLPANWAPVVAGVRRLLGPTTRDAESRELEIGEQQFAVTLAPLADGGLVLALTDITAASRAARIVAWGEMARQVAHEIKNPLTPMRLGLQHLRRVRADGGAGLPELVDQTAERLLGEIDRLDRIARSFARYGAPPEVATPLEAIDLVDAAREMASLFSLGGDGTTVEVEIEPGAGGLVAARREELSQVLLNLVDNARGAGATQIRLLVGAGVLTAADNGPGIPADQVGRIFDPTFSTTTSGTGLGLAIVRRLVEGWGGTVAVDGGAGSGARFTIRFLRAGGAQVASTVGGVGGV